MAKVKFGGGVAEIRGSVGGSNFSRNASGAVMRIKTSPVQKNSSPQMQVRSNFARMAAGWASLTDEQRATFETQAPAYNQTNIFGDSQTLSGQQLYNKLNGTLRQLDLAPISYCYPPISVAPPLANEYNFFNGENLMTLTSLSATSADEVIVVYCTGPMSPAIKNVKGKFRLVFIKPSSNAEGTEEIQGEWYDVFGYGESAVFSANTISYCQIVKVNTLTGITSTVTQYKGVVVPA